MSATNRGAGRAAWDYYPTPAWCVHRLLDALPMRHLRAWEPCAGDGAIIRAARAHSEGPHWTHATEIRHQPREQLVSLVQQVQIADALECDIPRADIAITNPPFGLALEIAQRLVPRMRVVMLLRLNWLASSKRSWWLRGHTPSVFVLPQRPSFTGGGTDATDYAWLAWGCGRHPLTILGDTPRSERASCTT